MYPAEIVGKRVRYRLDGSKVIKVICSINHNQGDRYSECTLNFGIIENSCGGTRFTRKLLIYLCIFDPSLDYDVGRCL